MSRRKPEKKLEEVIEIPEEPRTLEGIFGDVDGAINDIEWRKGILETLVSQRRLGYVFREKKYSVEKILWKGEGKGILRLSGFKGNAIPFCLNREGEGEKFSIVDAGRGDGSAIMGSGKVEKPSLDGSVYTDKDANLDTGEKEEDKVEMGETAETHRDIADLGGGVGIAMKKEEQIARMQAKADWYDACREADAKERELRTLEEKRKGFFSTLSRLFSKAFSIQESKKVDLYAFDEEVKKGRLEVTKLRKKAEELELLCKNLSDSEEKLEGEGEKKKETGDSKEEEKEKEIGGLSSVKKQVEIPKYFSKKKEEESGDIWDTYLSTLSLGEKEKLENAQKGIMEYLKEDISTKEEMTGSLKERRTQLRWGKCLLAAKSYGIGLKIEGKQFEELYNTRDREAASRWLVVAVHRIGMKELERVLKLLGGRRI